MYYVHVSNTEFVLVFSIHVLLEYMCIYSKFAIKVVNMYEFYR